MTSESVRSQGRGLTEHPSPFPLHPCQDRVSLVARDDSKPQEVDLDTLDAIADRIQEALEAKTAIREATLSRSRKLIQHASRAIRAAHRQEFDNAAAILSQAETIAAEMRDGARVYPDIYAAGYTRDALKELAEASIVLALIQDRPLPDPDDLGVEYAAYLNGLGEAVGEMRRHALDLMRQGHLERAETILGAMDDIYDVLVTMDFPDAITGGLRRTTDMVRGVVERTRGDLTMAMRQEELQKALREFESRVEVQGQASEAV